MKFATRTSPHTLNTSNVHKVMREVLLALLPGIAAMAWFFGPGVLINVLLAVTTAVASEALVMKLRGRPIVPVIHDLSAVVTGVLLALALPPLLPWWLTVIGAAFAIIMVKQLYGGIGYNPFNPAMAAYALLLISWPAHMTHWLMPSMLSEQQLNLWQTLGFVFSGQLPVGISWDALSGATPLDEMFTRLDMNEMVSEIRQSPLWGSFAGQGWEWVNSLYLLGGLYLLWRRVITWHIPLAMLGALLILSGIAHLIDPATQPSPVFHVFSGAAMLGAFFIATDPVSASTTKTGQLIFGASIGALVFVIREWGGYPDAVAFAVLLMNMAAPTIDYYTQPRVYGDVRDRRHD